MLLATLVNWNSWMLYGTKVGYFEVYKILLKVIS